MEAPVAKIEVKQLTIHNHTRQDDYFWLNQRENPEVIAYLEAENAYTKSMMAHTDALQEKLKSNPKSLVGNKGFRKYVSMDRDTVSINQQKIQDEERFDGKWVLRTNTELKSEQVALKYKELWQVEHVFRDMKSILDTRPVFHKRDETIRGHVFCSFLALVLRKELDRRLEKAGHCFEWADIKQDLKSLQEIMIEENGKTLSIRSECLGVCGKVFQAVGVAIPPTIREIS